MGRSISVANAVTGAVVYITTIAAWLIASNSGTDTGPLFYIAGPVIGSLFLVSPLSTAAENAKAAAVQTNGGLDARVKSAVTAALAERDAARTRQAVGDVSADNPAVIPGQTTIPVGETAP